MIGLNAGLGSKGIIVYKRKGRLYFIQIENEDGFIKIGYSQNVYKRLKSLQAASPYKLRLLKIMSTKDFKTVIEGERFLHEKFEDARIQGEWFRPTDALLEFIANIEPEEKAEDFYPPLLKIANALEVKHRDEIYSLITDFARHELFSIEILLQNNWIPIKTMVLKNNGIHVSKKSWPKMVARILLKAIRNVPIEVIERDMKANADPQGSETYKLLSKKIKRLSVM